MVYAVVVAVVILGVIHVINGTFSICLGVTSSIKAEIWLAHTVSPIWSGAFVSRFMYYIFQFSFFFWRTQDNVKSFRFPFWEHFLDVNDASIKVNLDMDVGRRGLRFISGATPAYTQLTQSSCWLLSFRRNLLPSISTGIFSKLWNFHQDK